MTLSWSPFIRRGQGCLDLGWERLPRVSGTEPRLGKGKGTPDKDMEEGRLFLR